MSFLRPEVLLLLPAVILLLVVLFRVRRKKRSVVPSLRIWLQAVGGARRSGLLSRPRVLLSEILLLLAASALVVAAAGPVLVRLAQRGEDIVIVVDDAPSMGATTLGEARLARAVEALSRVLVARQGEDRIAVIRAGDRGGSHLLLPFEGRPRALSVLTAVAPADHPVALDEALALALPLVSSSGDKGRLVILSDRAPEIVGRLEGELPLVRVESLTGIARAVSRNLAFVRLETNDAEEETEEMRIETTVRSFSTAEENLRVVSRFAENEGPVRETRLLPGTSVELSFTVPPEFEGEVELRIEGGDDLAVDDSALFQVRRARRCRTALITAGGESSLDPFLASALLACSDWIDPEATLWGGPGDVEALQRICDLVVLDGVLPEESQTIEVPSLWFGVEGRVLPFVHEGRSKDVHPSGLSLGHPLARGIRLDHVSVREAVQVSGYDEGDVVVDGVPGPLVLAGELHGAPYVYFAFRPAWSSLPFFSAFPLLVRNSLVSFFGEAGVKVSRSVPTGTTRGRALQLLGHGEPSSGHPLPDPVLTRGIHRLVAGRGHELVAVNFVHPLESDIARPISRDDAPQILAALPDVQRERWDHWLIFAALLLLLADWLVVYGLPALVRRG